MASHLPSPRVVSPGAEKVIGPHTFANWGSHCDTYPCAYFTAAAAIGMNKEEVDIFAKRLDKVFTNFKRKHTGPKLDLELQEGEPDDDEGTYFTSSFSRALFVLIRVQGHRKNNFVFLLQFKLKQKSHAYMALSSDDTSATVKRNRFIPVYLNWFCVMLAQCILIHER